MRRFLVFLVSVLVILSLVLAIAYLWPISDNQTFWEAVGAISAAITALSALFILFQVRALKAEDWERKVNGYVLVTDKIVNEKTINRMISLASCINGSSEIKDFASFLGDAFHVPKSLEQAQMLFERGYLDRELFFLTVGENLYDLKQAIDESNTRDSKIVKSFFSEWPLAQSLLDDGHAWFETRKTH